MPALSIRHIDGTRKGSNRSPSDACRRSPHIRFIMRRFIIRFRIIRFFIMCFFHHHAVAVHHSDVRDIRLSGLNAVHCHWGCRHGADAEARLPSKVAAASEKVVFLIVISKVRRARQFQATEARNSTPPCGAEIRRRLPLRTCSIWSFRNRPINPQFSNAYRPTICPYLRAKNNKYILACPLIY